MCKLLAVFQYLKKKPGEEGLVKERMEIGHHQEMLLLVQG
jgi:hypothetical protein